MTQQQRPGITPPEPPIELKRQWCREKPDVPDLEMFWFSLINSAIAWATPIVADQELKACSEWLRDDGWCGSLKRLRVARRPKPPNLAEEALGIIERGRDEWNPLPEDWDKLQAAAERLAELEKQASS
jgi:hypothetical protein